MDSALHCKIDSALSAVHSSFPEITTNEKQDEIIGGYLGGKLCWLAKGASFKLLNHSSKSILFSQTFTHYNDELSVKVTTCKKYDSNTLLIGLKTEEEKGTVYLFSLISNKVVKSVEVPYPVTCLEVVLHEGGATTSSKSFAQNLRWLFGVVAVGTEGGHLYLLDLRLDDKITCGTVPSKIEAVPTVVRNVPSVRDTVHSRSAHIAFELLDDQIIETVDCSDVSITALQFEQRTLSLLVGYSFGQFQIFDLTDLTLCFSSLHDDTTTEVVDFAFQEPENDPRNCCYLWVVRSPNDDELMENSPLIVTMHQLVYQKKDICDQNNRLTSFYQGLENCATQYELVLDASMGLSPGSGRSSLLQCSTIETYPPPQQSSEEESEYCSTPFTSLFIVGWQSCTDTSRSTQVLMFDINSWYNAHMPTCYRGDGEDITYIAIWEMDSVLTQSASRNLVSFSTPESSLQHFKSRTQPMPEQFSRPSAFSVITYVLTPDETLTLQMHGIQRQVILYLMEEKSVRNCLVEPSDTFDQMVEVGLVDDVGINSLTIERKREKILNAALDHSFFSFISRVIVDVASGEFASSGCTLRFVMEWAWKTVAIIKDSFDQLCVPIFDCSTVTLDVTIHTQLSKYQRHLGDLAHIFKGLLREASVSSDQSVADIELKHKVVQLIQGYIKVLRWFIEARLLPEQLQGHVCAELKDHPEFHFVYEQQTLKSVFERRRKELKGLKSAEECFLIIDGTVNEASEALKKNWTEMSDDKSGLYPPPSIMALLDMYYLDGVDTELKHTIVTYFLLDVLAMVETGEGDSNCEENYKQSMIYHREIVAFFPSTFHLPNNTTNLIKAFWLLDHKEFHESVTLFCDAGTETAPLPWQHRQILLAYMLQGHWDLALKYLLNKQPSSQSAEDAKLKIEIYAKNGLPQHALEVAQTSSDPTNVDVIYFHLFSCCFENNLLNTLLELPVSEAEDELVSKYLQSGSIPNSHYLLVLYHLKKSRYAKAIKAYQQNKHSYMMVERDELVKQQHETLKHVIQGYLNALPEVEREIACASNKAFEWNKHMRKEVLQAKPLSAALNSRGGKAPLSHAAVFSMSFQRKKAELAKPSDTPFRKKSFGKSETPLHLTGKILFSNDISDSTTVKTPTRKSMSRRSRSSFGGGNDSPLFTRYSRLSSAQVTSPVYEVSQKTMRKSSLSGMASLLLQTPPITRKVPRSTFREPDFDMMTPQSILKVKLLKAKSPSLPSIPQHSTTSSNMTGNESGSLTSLSRMSQEPEAAPTRINQQKTTRDSESSNENPRVRKQSIPDIFPVLAIATPTGSVYEGRSFKEYFLEQRNRDLLFAVPTPSVDRPAFKGLRLNETKSTPFTPKKLRFFGVAASPSDVETSTSPPKPIANDNIVVVRSANEDLDVDVTGDVMDDIVELSSNDQMVSFEESHEVTTGASVDDENTSPFSIAEDAFPSQETAEIVSDLPESVNATQQSEIADGPTAARDEFALEMSCSEEEVDDNNIQEQLPDVEGAERALETTAAVDLNAEANGEIVIVEPQPTEDFTLQMSDSEGEVLSVEEELNKDEVMSVRAESEKVEIRISKAQYTVEESDVEFFQSKEAVLTMLSSAADVEESDEMELKLDSSGSGDALSPADPDNQISLNVGDSTEETETGFLSETKKLDQLLTQNTAVDAKPLEDIVVMETVVKETMTTTEEVEQLAETSSDMKPQPAEGICKPEPAAFTDTKPIQTPTTTRLISEPIFLLSPPTTRGHRSKAALIKDDPGTPEPHFVLSPATTRTRSTRKNREKQKIEATPNKKSRLASPERSPEHVTTAPVGASTKKGRKSPSRKVVPLTPSRSSARVKARASEVGGSPSKKNTAKNDESGVNEDEEKFAEPPTTTRASSRSRSTRARTPSRQEQPEEKQTTTRSTRKPSKQTSDLHDSHELRSRNKGDSSDTDDHQKELEMKTPSKRRKVSSSDQYPHGEEDPPTVVRTSSRRRTRAVENQQTQQESESEAPVVSRTASKTRGKGKRSHSNTVVEMAAEEEVTMDPPTVTRTASKTRSQRKGKQSTEDLPTVTEDIHPPPTVTRTASKRRTKAQQTVQDEKSLEKDADDVVADPPIVTRTSSRRRKTTEVHEQHVEKSTEEIPTVTRTSSRRRKTAETVEVAELEEVTEPPHVTRSSSRKSRTKVSKNEVEEQPPPTVTRTSSRRGKTKSVGVEDGPPEVAKTTSKSKHGRGAVRKMSKEQEDPPVVTRTSSRNRGKAPAPNSDSEPVTTNSSSRTKQDKVIQEEEVLPDIAEEEDARGVSSPSDDDVVLIEMPKKGNTPGRKITSVTTLLETKTTTSSVKFPIVARRRAKVFIRKKIT